MGIYPKEEGMDCQERFTYNEKTAAIEAHDIGAPHTMTYEIPLDRIKGLRSDDRTADTVEGWMNHLAGKTLRFDGQAIASFVSAVMDAGLLQFVPPKRHYEAREDEAEES